MSAGTQPPANSRFQTLEGLRRDFKAKHEAGYSYPVIGLSVGISGGLVWSIVKKGYEPKTAKIRRRLNLPPLTAEAPYCPVHDTVHCFDCQTEQVKPKPKPAKRKPRIRIAADVTEEQRERLHEIAGGLGMSWSEFCQALADREFWPIEPRWS